MNKQARKVIRVQHTGAAGNRIFQFLFALLIQKQVEGSKLIGYDIPDFGLKASQPSAIPESHLLVEGKHEFNVGRIVHALNSHVLDAVTFRTYSQRMEYLPSLSEARRILAAGLNPSFGAPVPDEAILINIRWPQPSDGGHGDYMPLPISYYKMLTESCGLRPIFMGQIQEGPYFDALKRLMPDADFWPSVTPLSDFNTIANARHLACSVSSFSWLAAWLSNSASAIHLPLCGIFNPIQRPDIDLLPYPDPRFHYYQFPVMHWRNTQEQIASLCSEEQEYPAVKLSERDIVQLKRSKLRFTV